MADVTRTMASFFTSFAEINVNHILTSPRTDATFIGLKSLDFIFQFTNADH